MSKFDKLIPEGILSPDHVLKRLAMLEPPKDIDWKPRKPVGGVESSSCNVNDRSLTRSLNKASKKRQKKAKTYEKSIKRKK